MCANVCVTLVCLSGRVITLSPCEAACLSVVVPCSWPTLGEVNLGQLESMGKGIRSSNTLLSSLGFCPDARHLKSARD